MPPFVDGVTPITAAALNKIQDDAAAALGGDQLPGTLLDPGTPLGDRAAALFAPRPAAPTTAAAPGVFDRTVSVYNLKPSHLRRIRAALGKVLAQTGYAKIAFLGDSTVVGAYGGDSGKASWPARFKAMLASAGYASAGTGLVPAFNNYAAAEPRISLFSGEGSLSSFSNMITNSTTLNGIQFDTATTGETGTILELFYDDASAAFEVTLDAEGTRRPVATGGTNTVKSKQFTGLANTTHKAIAWRVSGTRRVLGFELLNNATYGVRTYNAALSGAKTDSLASANYQHVTQTATNRATGWGADLCFIMCETNDAGTGVAPATFKANLQAAISAVVNSQTDVVLVTGFPLNGTDLAAYTAALYELADANDLPLIDLQARWGTWAAANALGLFTDNAHPTAAGYADAGRAVFKGLGI